MRISSIQNLSSGGGMLCGNSKSPSWKEFEFELFLQRCRMESFGRNYDCHWSYKWGCRIVEFVEKYESQTRICVSGSSTNGSQSKMHIIYLEGLQFIYVRTHMQF